MNTTTSTKTTGYFPPNMLSSTSSLSSSSHNAFPNLNRVYKQANQLFLTRQTAEALEILEPLIRKPSPSPISTLGSNGAAITNSAAGEEAPIASASRSARVKIWNLYIAILNVVAEMDAEEGRKIFGRERWKQLAGLARDGGVWKEVARDGYRGVEGAVDADVVASLATLLLAHAPDQKLTQQRLESYLSVLDSISPDPSHLEESTATTGGTIGTPTPRDLMARLKVLEIYTLHVLPRTGEWDYAREFINLSEVLDDERKEAYLQTLQSIQEEQDYTAKREQELQKQRDKEVGEAKRKEEAERRLHEAKRLEEQERERKRRQGTAKRNDGANGAATEQTKADKTATSKPKPNATSTNRSASSSAPPPTHASGSDSTSLPSQPTGPAKKSRSPPPSVYRRASSAILAFQHSLMQMGQGMSKNPMVILRTILFLVALLTALARRDVRDRLRQAKESVWEKVRRTVGMGVKVSYI